MDRTKEILLKIKADPLKYLDAPSFELLTCFLLGYDYEKNIHVWPNDERDCLNGFDEFVKQKYRFGYEYTVSWREIIKFFSPSDENAFYTFYELLDEFFKEKR